MSEQKFPPRVGVERQHICALTGLGRWKAVHGPRAHYIIDPVVNDEYLSLAEHQHLMAEKDRRIERLREALTKLTEEMQVFLNVSYKHHFPDAREAQANALAALQEDK